MRGGNRPGSGRKQVPANEKKKSVNIYLSNELYSKVSGMDFDNCKSLSQKFAELIDIGVQSIEAGHFPSPSDSCGNSDTDASLGAPLADVMPISGNPEAPERAGTDEAGGLTFIDLFAGIGGIRKGFEDENTRCVFSSEWDRYAAKTYQANYGEVPLGDITQIAESEIPDHHVLLAGFPCQPFSNIGKREGFAHETQGTLFFDVLRILRHKQPRMFLLENVKGILTNDGGNTFRVIINSLKELGYSVFSDVLDAQNFGLPQRRERVVIVGFHPDLNIEEFALPKSNNADKVSIGRILERGPSGYSISRHLQKSYLFKKDDGKPQLVDFDSDFPANTLVASYHKIQRLTGTFVRDGETGVRLFSELELKRLMGFPEDFAVPVSRTQMYRQFGNSVAVPMVKAVADAMKSAFYASEVRGG